MPSTAAVSCRFEGGMDVMNEGMKQCAGGAFLGARECAWVCEELQDAGDARGAYAPVRRLDESIAHARKLHADGKVYSAEQWEDHDVQRKIAAPNLANMDAKLDTYNITLSEKTTKLFKEKSHYVNFTNSFFRDMYDTVVKGTTHENWFK
jgi:hypothetical protein